MDIIRNDRITGGLVENRLKEEWKKLGQVGFGHMRIM